MITAGIETVWRLLVALGWGASVGVTVLVAPVIFTTLDNEAAFRFTRSLWPRYFTLLAGVGYLGFGLGWYLEAGWQALTTLGAAAVLMTLNVVGTEVMRWLRPDPDSDPDSPAYDLLHRGTVMVNVVVIVCFGWALASGL